MKREYPAQNTNDQAVPTANEYLTDNLADLPASEEQAEQARGGGSNRSGGSARVGDTFTTTVSDPVY